MSSLQLPTLPHLRVRMLHLAELIVKENGIRTCRLLLRHRFRMTRPLSIDLTQALILIVREVATLIVERCDERFFAFVKNAYEVKKKVVRMTVQTTKLMAQLAEMQAKLTETEEALVLLHFKNECRQFLPR
ncbi:hypothetical protein BBP40_007709 [Aspergillus hancockii]|nr:hypothetical protein BBP40_007709 [Aspergillus hancockii]